jgi:hypothetical protein
MISLQKRFLFVHILKTAGNWIQTALRDYSEDQLVALRKEQDASSFPGTVQIHLRPKTVGSNGVGAGSLLRVRSVQREHYSKYYEEKLRELCDRSLLPTSTALVTGLMKR